MVRRWPSGCARGAVLVAPLRGACARPCPLRRRAARPRALWCFGRCGGLAFRSAGGRAPRAVAPSLRGARLLALGLLRFAPAAVALVLRGRASLRSPPSRAWAAALVAAVAARRARSLAPASPGACRRCAASAWGGPAVPGPRCGGARRSGGRGGRAGARCGGPRLGALARPPRGVGVPPLRRRFFRGCCGALLSRAARRGLASPALLSALPSAAASCALTAALLPRGLFAPPAHFVVQGEVESQGVTRSTTYSAGLLLDIQNKLRIRQNSYYYFAELFVDFVNRHCPALLVCSYQKSRWQIWTIRMRRRCCATF